MGNEAQGPSIADGNIPNAGRIYDYLLGGTHNFEVDREAAKRITRDNPEVGIWVKLIRWFLGTAVQRLVDEGYRKFLDFASGLPTGDHIHYLVPKGTRVIYSDIDPVTVAYAQEVVKDLPDVAFVQGNAGRPETVLGQEIVPKLFGDDRRVAIGFSGIAWFLPDDEIAHAFRTLYEWASPGAKMFISEVRHLPERESASQKIADVYKSMRQPVFYRSEEQFREMLGGWRLCEPGVAPLQEWLKLRSTNVVQAVESVGGTPLVGAIVEKP